VNTYSTTLSGAGPISLELGAGCSFQGTSFVCGTTADTVPAASDLVLDFGTVDFNSHTLDLSAGPYDVNITGTLQECDVVGGSGSTLTGGGQYMMSVTGSRLILAGTWCISSGNVTMTDIVNAGTVQNYPNAYQSLYIHGNFVNLGTVRNNLSGYGLSIYADANVMNDGVWNNYYLYLNGASDQILSAPNDSLFTLSYLADTNSAGAVIAAATCTSAAVPWTSTARSSISRIPAARRTTSPWKTVPCARWSCSARRAWSGTTRATRS
jgi:hypothetical protein